MLPSGGKVQRDGKVVIETDLVSTRLSDCPLCQNDTLCRITVQNLDPRA